MLRGRLQLPEALIIEEDEKLILLDRPAKGQAVLPHAKRGNGWIALQVVVVEVPRIEHGISEIPKSRAVPIVRPRLGNDIDLPAGLRAVLRIVQSAVDAIFVDRVLRNLQARL